MQWLSDWWNDIELWMAQQSFWLQFVLVMIVVGPLCVGLAWLIDRLVDRLSARFGPSRRSEPSLDVELDPELDHELHPAPAPVAPAKPEPDDQPAGTAS